MADNKKEKETEYEAIKLSNEMTLKEKIIHVGETADLGQTLAYLFLGAMFLYIAIYFGSPGFDGWDSSIDTSSKIMSAFFFIAFLIVFVISIFKLVFIIKRKKIPVEANETNKKSQNLKPRLLGKAPKLVLALTTLTLLHIIVIKSNDSPDSISPILPILIILLFTSTIFTGYKK